MGDAGFPAKRQAEIDPGDTLVMLGEGGALVGYGGQFRHRKPDPGARPGRPGRMIGIKGVEHTKKRVPFQGKSAAAYPDQNPISTL